MRRLLNQRTRTLGAVVVVCAVLGGIAGIATASARSGQSAPSLGDSPATDRPSESTIPSESELDELELTTDNIEGVTPDGRTYGRVPGPVDAQHGGWSAGDAGVMPDLVAVIGDHGATGYVDSAVLMDDGSEVTNPQEAAEYMRKKARRGPTELPVYAKDGVTVVDAFTMQ